MTAKPDTQQTAAKEAELTAVHDDYQDLGKELAKLSEDLVAAERERDKAQAVASELRSNLKDTKTLLDATNECLELTERERNSLRELLAEAIEEARAHRADNYHVTSAEVIDGWETALKAGKESKL